MTRWSSPRARVRRWSPKRWSRRSTRRSLRDSRRRRVCFQKKKKKKTGEETGARRLRVGDPRAALLLAAVLLDTQNLNASATRVHARDVAIVPILASSAGTGDVGAFHDELKRRRFDQSGLSPRDLLRRDYKQWRFVPRATPRAPATSATSAWDVGVASFGVPLGEMASDARAIRDACAAFARDKGVDALALMSAFDDETTTTPTFRRQFAIVFFDADAEGKGASLSAPPRDDALVALSARMFEPGGVLPVALGGLEPVADATALDAFGGFAFEQGDPTRSRKKAQPALAAFFEGRRRRARRRRSGRRRRLRNASMRTNHYRRRNLYSLAIQSTRRSRAPRASAPAGSAARSRLETTTSS